MRKKTNRAGRESRGRFGIRARPDRMGGNQPVGNPPLIAVTQHDAEVRFRALAARASVSDGLAVRERLDRTFGADDAEGASSEGPA